MKFVVLICLIFSFYQGYSQKGNYVLTGLDRELDNRPAFSKLNLHLTLKPFHPKDRELIYHHDADNNLSYDITTPYGTRFQLYPLFDVQSGYDLNSSVVFANMIGAGTFAELGQKWLINANYLFGFWQDGIPNEFYAVYKDVIPGIGYAHPLRTRGFRSHTAFGSVSFTPNNHFSFELGRNKHFIGHGYRSLMLSDNANVYPYFKIDTKVWRIRYTNIYTWMYDIRGASNPGQFYNKFTTKHMLDWNVTKSWSLGVFESIVWQGKDTLLNRGYDINYLNPVIFYRPVEYALGSSDNALLGLNSNIKIGDKFNFYTQIVIDEFLLERFKADLQHFFNKSDTSIDYGWWANKYAVQVGFKWYDVGVENLDLLSEFNLSRPFMYSHGSVYQNYGHFNQPLAHPLGANFYEWVNIISYKFGKFGVREQFVWSVHGLDNFGYNFGGDIYQSYANRQKTYGHTIAQGNRSLLLFNDFSVYYHVSDQLNLDVSLGFNFRSQKDEYQQTNSNFLYLRLRTGLWNRYYDY